MYGEARLYLNMYPHSDHLGLEGTFSQNGSDVPIPTTLFT